MSVIGRLDKQVNDILISPLEQERPGRTGAEPAERANTLEPSSTPQTRNPPSGSGKHKSSEHAPSEKVELPVWLL